MLTRELVSIVNEIEVSFNVVNLEYKGFKIWPLIRMLIFFNKFGIVKNSTTKPPVAMQHAGIVKNVFYPYFYFKWLDAQNEKGVGDTDILMLLDANMRNEKINDKYFHKFGDSIKELLPDSVTMEFIEFAVNGKRHVPRYSPTEYISSSVYKFFLLNKLKRNRKLTNIQGWDAFVSNHAVERHLKLDQHIVAREADRVLEYRDYFLTYFKKRKIKIFTVMVYYSKMCMGATLAAKKLGIKTVEIQHGQQGDLHLMYANWKSFPKDGYQVLPQYFWMWGQKSFERVNIWMANSSAHKALVGGNPWLAYNSNENVEPATIEKREWKDRRKRILVCAQYMKDLVDGPIPEAIRLSDPKDTFWLIRFHPRFIDGSEKFKEIIRDMNCEHVDYEMANTLPLYDLYKLVNYQITFWSTVAYEGLAFGVNTIIVHENGKDAMSHYIENQIFGFALNPEDILAALYKFQFHPEPRPGYIVGSGEIVGATITHILES